MALSDRNSAANAAGPPILPAFPSFQDAIRIWLRIGCLSFGGPAGQIALLHREVVDERNWMSDRRFLHALNFCTVLPGPEAQQLAIYLGWLMHGAAGGFAAGLLFIFPGAAVMLGLSIIYATLGTVPLVAAVFFGLKNAVLILVLQALLRIGRRALRGKVSWALAAISFAALFLLNVPFPAVILVAGITGYIAPIHFVGGAHGKPKEGAPALLDAIINADAARMTRLARGARIAGLMSIPAWLLPIAVLLPQGGAYANIAWFFSKMAIVTFGGAYAVLAYVAQEAVERYHWLSASEMLTGLGLAETTPGPLILVLQFVGFLSGYRAPGALTGIAGGIVASALTLWVTFAPCFVFVFLGAPLIERLQHNKALTATLSAITAGVVGVIANLALWFALHTLFRQTVHLRAGLIATDVPVLSSVDPWALLISLIAAVALLGLKLGVARTLAICSIASIVFYFDFSLL